MSDVSPRGRRILLSGHPRLNLVGGVLLVLQFAILWPLAFLTEGHPDRDGRTASPSETVENRTKDKKKLAVTYRASGEVGKIHILVSTPASGSVQDDVAMPFERTYDIKRGQLVQFIVRAPEPDTRVGCTILVEGVVVSELTGTSAHCTATVGEWPDPGDARPR